MCSLLWEETAELKNHKAETKGTGAGADAEVLIYKVRV